MHARYVLLVHFDIFDFYKNVHLKVTNLRVLITESCLFLGILSSNELRMISTYNANNMCDL